MRPRAGGPLPRGLCTPVGSWCVCRRVSRSRSETRVKTDWPSVDKHGRAFSDLGDGKLSSLFPQNLEAGGW